MSEPDTQPVTYRVLGVERVTGAGRLVGLAIVEVEVGGVALKLHGVELRRQADGGLEVTAPVFRHPRTGEWLPATMLPPELSAALAYEVIQCARGMGLEL